MFEMGEDLKIRDKILGSMVGGASGDALGYAVEFEDYASIVRRYGPQGITRYSLAPSGKALISDDTQMTLFTAAGCLLGVTRGCCRGIMGDMSCYCSVTYQDWLHTQTHPFRQKRDAENFHTWLMSVPELYNRRAPGTTCLNALRDMRDRVESKNNSCGCGGVMRVAPIPLLFERHRMESSAAQEAADVARLTHHHPLGFMPAAVLALIIQDILHNEYEDREGLECAVLSALEQLPKVCSEQDNGIMFGAMYPEHVKKLTELIKKSVLWSQLDNEDVYDISHLGQGWTGHEALAIAVYCALKHADSFENAIVSAVNHSGDSDSTGAICGNIMGALLGRSRIPSYYTDNLEILDVIEDMANDLYTGCLISEYCTMDSVDKWRWRMKYVDSLYWEPREQMEAHILDGSLFDKLGFNTEYCMKVLRGEETN